MATKPAVRRSAEDTADACQQVLDAMKDGMIQAVALKKFGVSGSVYKRWRAKAKDGTLAGTVDASLLGSRPAKKKGNKHIVDINSIYSVAKRLGAIEKMLAKVKPLMAEERRMSERLLVLLKQKTK